MATDEKVNEATESVEEVVSETKTIPEDAVTKLIEAKMEEITNKFTATIDDITKKNEEEVKALRGEISKKDEEIQKQKDITAKIVMNSSFGKQSDDIDFAGADFDSINWDKQASEYMKKIDSKLV